jgi:UDP-N-acetyl-D-galactosamine dehydrogenase
VSQKTAAAPKHQPVISKDINDPLLFVAKDSARRRIGVIGLGYVGLPVAAGFAQAGFDVVGYDIDAARVMSLREGIDVNNEMKAEHIDSDKLQFTNKLDGLKSQDFFIVAVPTPVDETLKPDLGSLFAASKAVGKILKKGDIVVYEATVYPGATEEECTPLLEETSGLKAGSDFFVAYSPERINPGDASRNFSSIRKVVAAGDDKTLAIVADTYGAVIKAGVYRAPSIRVAEAAKAIENTQRDLNIALVNELALLFGKLGLDTQDVLEAAGTKWNFLREFTPGLVGGHCIGVDPYYITHKAQSIGFHPQVILAGRNVNDSMGRHVAQECVRLLMQKGVKKPRVTVLGLTYKENVSDIRNTRVTDIVRELRGYGIEVCVCDLHAQAAEVKKEYGFDLQPLEKAEQADAVIFAVPHDDYIEGGWDLMRRLLKDEDGIVLDVKNRLAREDKPASIRLWRL